MAKMYHPTAPFIAPVSGTMEQRLQQIVKMINDLQANVMNPTFSRITLTDNLGQTWNIFMQSNGQIRTELVTRS